LAIEQHEVARAVEAAPVVAPENAAIERVRVWRLYENEAARRQKIPHCAQDGWRIGNMLNQIEHEHEVKFFGGRKFLNATGMKHVTNSLRSGAGAFVEINFVFVLPGWTRFESESATILNPLPHRGH
jgi:hypothetical protein